MPQKQAKDAVCGRLRATGNMQGGHTSSGLHGESLELRMIGEERELNQDREAEEKGRGPRSYEVGSTELGSWLGTVKMGREVGPRLTAAW